MEWIINQLRVHPELAIFLTLFAGPKWSVRVSLVNLNETDYVKIGQSIKFVLEEYAQTWKASKEWTK